MQLTCPWCGTREISEFSFGGDAGVERPDFDDSDADAWRAYLYARENPCGPHSEFWHHEAGCRQWIVVQRDTSNHRILSIRATRDNPR